LHGQYERLAVLLLFYPFNCAGIYDDGGSGKSGYKNQEYDNS
jgi:hypothetical protein